jgi:hypothetical protein
MPVHAELVKAWPARTTPSPADLARGWWQPTIEALREERRRAASLERACQGVRARAAALLAPVNHSRTGAACDSADFAPSDRTAVAASTLFL